MRLVISIVFAAVSAALFFSFLYGCASFTTGISAGGVCRFVYDFQTLLASVFALLAAFFAAWPVFSQLRLVRLQSNIMTRDVLLKRLTGAEQRSATCSRLVESITSEFEMVIHGGDPESEPNVQPAWAHGAEQTVGSVVEQLEVLQRSLSDPHAVNAARADVIVAAKSLQDCLYVIPLPFTAPWDDPEIGMSNAEIDAAKTNADRDAKQGERDLPDRIAAVRRSGNALREVYGVVTKKLRSRLRAIDDLVLETSV